MNPEQWEQQFKQHKTPKGYLAAIIIIFIGMILLLKRLPLQIPEWVFSWDTILIVIGILLGIKSRFRHWLWFVFVLLGTGSVLANYFLEVQYQNLVFPVGLIIFGIFVFFKLLYHRKNIGGFPFNPQDHPHFNHNRRYHHRQSPPFGHHRNRRCYHHRNPTTEEGDSVNIENTFGETNRNIISKEFKGGVIKNTFGSVNINLTQCDIQGKVYIHVENTFGSVAFFVPSNWKVISEIDAHLSGIDDKSFYDAHPDEEEKFLILKGKSVFGGIEIKNFL